jgi:iron(III) transport system substrate-binding protein
MGEEKGMAYLREFARQQPTGLAVAARQVLDMVIAGEYALALNIFNNHAVISAAKGAPVDWIPMNPALGVLSVVSVTKDAPHPNAGRLFLDFLTSEEGQKIYRDAEYLPVDPNVAPKDLGLRPDGDKFKAIYKTPEEVDREMPRWAEIAKSLFR